MLLGHADIERYFSSHGNFRSQGDRPPVLSAKCVRKGPPVGCSPRVEAKRVWRALRLLAISIATVAEAHAATYSVGVSGPCTHADLSSAVAAAAANPGPDEIHISISQSLLSPISITDQSIDIIGGYANCGSASPSGLSLVTGFGGGAFRIDGPHQHQVSFVNLNLASLGDYGSLIRIEQNRVVHIYGTILGGATSETDGGAVWMTGPSSILYLEPGSLVRTNVAFSRGGGVFCQNGGTIFVSNETGIEYNEATDGGGLYLDGCTFNSESEGDHSSGFGSGEGGISHNEASSEGGGLYASNGSQVNFYGNPWNSGSMAGALVSSNSAQYGGGLFLTGIGTSVTARDGRISSNIGLLEGGGVAVRQGAWFTMTAVQSDCAEGLLCSQLTGNSTGSPGNGGFGGGIIVESGGTANVYRTLIEGNQAQWAGSAVVSHGPGSTAIVEGCIVKGNVDGAPVFRAQAASATTVAYSTIFEPSGLVPIFEVTQNASLKIVGNIQIGTNLVTPLEVGTTLVADCLMVTEVATIPPPPDAQTIEVIGSLAQVFTDHEHGDFRLRTGSQAIDFCDTAIYTPVAEIELEGRGFDVESIPNSPWGAYDLGADEWHELFGAGFEFGGCTEWSQTTGCP